MSSNFTYSKRKSVLRFITIHAFVRQGDEQTDKQMHREIALSWLDRVACNAAQRGKNYLL